MYRYPDIDIDVDRDVSCDKQCGGVESPLHWALRVSHAALRGHLVSVGLCSLFYKMRGRMTFISQILCFYLGLVKI